MSVYWKNGKQVSAPDSDTPGAVFWKNGKQVSKSELEPAKTSITTRGAAKPSTTTPARAPEPASARGSLGKTGGASVKTTPKAAVPPAKVVEEDKVTEWQSTMDTLEQQQMQIQQDQMNLLHNQIHILTRELGDLQKEFVFLKGDIYTKVDDLQCDLTAAQEEAHSALRLELAQHGNNAAEMKAAWEEAQGALADSMDTNLAQMAADHAAALDAHKSEQSRALAEHGDNLGNAAGSIESLEAAHAARAEEHSAALQAGLDDVHGNLQKELAELKSGHAVNLQAVVTDITEQLDKLTMDVEQMATDLKAAQEEAHSALRLELAEHAGNAEEMAAAWKEAQGALSDSMDDNLAKMAADHAALLDAHKNEQAQALAEHGEALGGASGNLANLEDMHNARAAEHAAALQDGLEGVHNTLQNELAELRSGHAVNLQAIVADITEQVDTLTKDMEQMALDIKNTQEEAHSALRLELAQQSGDAEAQAAAWKEAQGALQDSMDDNLAKMAADHVKAIEDHKAEQAAALAAQTDALADHADTHGNLLADMKAQMQTMADAHGEIHDGLGNSVQNVEANLTDALGNAHDKLQKELADIKSGHLENLQGILTDLTEQVDNITLALATEGEQRKVVEDKLDQMFAGLRNVMSVQFLGDGIA